MFILQKNKSMFLILCCFLSFSAGPPPVTLPYYSEENLAKHGNVLDHNSKPNLYMTGMSDGQNDHMCSGAPDHGKLINYFLCII